MREITVVISTSKPSTNQELVPLFVSAFEGFTLPKPQKYVPYLNP